MRTVVHLRRGAHPPSWARRSTALHHGAGEQDPAVAGRFRVDVAAGPSPQAASRSRSRARWGRSGSRTSEPRSAQRPASTWATTILTIIATG